MLTRTLLWHACGSCCYEGDESTKPYVAAIIAMYQDVEKGGKTSDKMIIIEWFFRPEEIKGGRQSHHGEDELFTRSAGGIRLATYSIACVDELCLVLKFSQYCRYRGDTKRKELIGGKMDATDKQSVYFIRDGKDAARQSERVKAQAAKRRRTPGGSSDSTPKKQAKMASGVVNKRNSKGETRLHAAAGRGDNKAVLGLLSQRAEVNVSCNAGWTPLHEAALNGHTSVVQTLISSDANLNAQGPGSTLALHDAVESGHVAIVTALMRAGATKELKNGEGHYPQDLTTNPEMIEALNETRSRRRAAAAASWNIRAHHDLKHI